MKDDITIVVGVRYEFEDGDRVEVVGGVAGAQWGTARWVNGQLQIVLDGKIECAHGECDQCQRARGEDPRNYAESASLTPPDAFATTTGYRELTHAEMVELHEFDREVRRLNGLPDPEPGFELGRCECGSGSHVRGPGHSDWCPLHQP